MQVSIDDRKFLWLAAILGAILLRRPLIATLLPFLLALALAAMIDPPVNFLQAKTGAPRPLAAAISLLLLVLSGGYIFLIVSTKVLSELVSMGSLLQKYQRVPVDFAANAIAKLNELNELFDQRGLPQAVQDNILQAVDNLTRAAVGMTSQGINVVLNTMSKVPSLVIIVVIALIATYFLVKDRESLVESALAISPPALRERVRDAQQRIVVDLVGFFRGQIILMFLTIVVVGLGLAGIGINYWMTLAILAGMLDVIPVLGPGFLFVPWAIGAATLGLSTLAMKLLAILAVSFLVRQIFQAKILGDSIGIHPLMMLVALYAGIHFFGVQGFIVAPVLVIVGKGLYNFKVRPTERKPASQRGRRGNAR